MKQTVHIFLKDVRHLWIEILIALAMIVAQAWLGRYQWMVEGPTSGYEPQDILHMASFALVPLMVIAWILLIARCVLDDRLVGDRQFWLTRPYEWKKMLAAKLLFITAFILVPFFGLQCLLLAQAGFSPFRWIAQILLSLLLMIAGIVLPVMAIASVTSGFGRMVLTLVGVLLFVVIENVIAALAGHGNMASATSPIEIGDYFTGLLFFLVWGAIVLVQYKKRLALVAGLLLIGAFAGACAIDFIDPDRMLIDHNYPAASGQQMAPLKISINNQSGGYERDIATLQRREQSISLQIAGIERGSAMRIDLAKVGFETSDGFRWRSAWETQKDSGMINDMEMTSDADTAQAEVRITMPETVYERLKNVSSTLTVTVAVTELRAGTTTEFTLPKPMQDLKVPGFGICVPQPGFALDAGNLACRFPFQAPLTLVSARWFDKSCAQVQGEPGVEGSGWAGTLNYSAPTPEFIPVQWPAFPLSNSERIVNGRPISRNLCPGTPVTFTPYSLVRRMQAEVTENQFRFPSEPKFGMNERPAQLRAR